MSTPPTLWTSSDISHVPAYFDDDACSDSKAQQKSVPSSAYFDDDETSAMKRSKSTSASPSASEPSSPTSEAFDIAPPPYTPPAVPSASAAEIVKIECSGECDFPSPQEHCAAHGHKTSLSMPKVVAIAAVCPMAVPFYICHARNRCRRCKAQVAQRPNDY